MESELGRGSREDLVRLGSELDESAGKALALTEKVLKIRSRLGKMGSLVANRAQQEYAQNAWRKQRNIVLKARQMGITTWIAGQFFLRTITHPGTVTLQVAHHQAAAEQIFRIVHRFLDHLPEELREGALKSAKASSRRLLIPALDSEYLVETAGDRNAGRGLTISNLHCTELARWPGNAEETLYGLMATLSPEGLLTMESTPMGASGSFWKEWKDAERTGTMRHFFPWWLEPAYRSDPVPEESFTEEERALMTKCNLSPETIGYRRLIRENFRSLAKQEYAEDADECFLASGACFFETPAIDKRLAELPPPAENPRDLRVWLPPQPGREYLVAVDPAGGGLGGDFAAIEVIDKASALQCAELQARLSTLETAQEAARLAREYHQATIAVERNGLGAGVVAYLNGVERYGNLYMHEDRQLGFPTNVATRPWALGLLASALVDSPALFSSERLLRECRTFVRVSADRAEAQAGEHDDLVMAMAIALAVRDKCLGARRLQ